MTRAPKSEAGPLGPRPKAVGALSPTAEGRRGPEAGPLGRALRPTAEGRRGPEAVGPLGRALRPSA